MIPQLGGINQTVYYYVSGSLLENPAPRQVNYLLQGNANSIQASFKTTYDFLITQRIVPELIVFGLGPTTVLWAISDAVQCTYMMMPYPYEDYTSFGLPPCSGEYGRGFKYLDFLLYTVLM
jgi:hypothetical protein